MNLNQEAVVAFILDVEKLSRRNKPLFIERLDAKRDEFDGRSVSYLTNEGFEKWKNDIQPKAAAWHWVWCIAAHASVALSQDITPEIWAEAQTMLKEALSDQESTQSASRARHNGTNP